MSTQNDRLDQLEALASDMLLAARQENWDLLANQEVAYTQLLQKLINGSNTAQAQARLGFLLDTNREILSRVARRKEEIGELLSGLSPSSTQTKAQ